MYIIYIYLDYYEFIVDFKCASITMIEYKCNAIF